MKQKFKIGDVVKIKDNKRIRKNLRKVITTVSFVIGYEYEPRTLYELNGIRLARYFCSYDLDKVTNAEALVYLTHEPFDEDKQ